PAAASRRTAGHRLPTPPAPPAPARWSPRSAPRRQPQPPAPPAKVRELPRWSSNICSVQAGGTPRILHRVSGGGGPPRAVEGGNGRRVLTSPSGGEVGPQGG